jgi:hypothetical protein
VMDEAVDVVIELSRNSEMGNGRLIISLL